MDTKRCGEPEPATLVCYRMQWRHNARRSAQ
jgi:hypothetical protein